MNTRRLLVVLLALLLAGCGFRTRLFGPRRQVHTEGPMLVTPDAMPVTPPIAPQAMRSAPEERPLQLAPASPRRGLLQRPPARAYPRSQPAVNTMPSNSPRLDFERPASPVIPSRPNRYESYSPIEGPTRVRQTAALVPVAEGVVAGQVVDSSGRAQPGATVVAVSSGTSRGSSAETIADAAGQFELKGLNPNQRYLLLATVPTRTEPLLGRASVTPPASGLTISVARAFTRSAPSAIDSPRPVASSLARLQSSGSAKAAGRGGAAPNVPELPWEPGPNARASRSSTAVETGNSRTDTTTIDRLAQSDGANAAGLQQPDSSMKRAAASGWQPVRDVGEPLVALDTRVVDESPAVDPMRPLIRPEPSARRVTKAETPSPAARRASAGARPPTSRSPHEEQSSPPRAVARSNPVVPRQANPHCQFDAGRLVDFELSDTQARGVRFSELGGDLVLIDFWGTWCMPCLRSIPKLNDLHQRYGTSGLRVVGVAYEQEDTVAERAARVQAVQNQLGVRYPLLLGDESGHCPLKEQFRVGVFPTLILIDRQGREVWRAEGVNPLEFQRLESILQQRLAGSRSNERA